MKFVVCVARICRPGADALSALEREIADRRWLVVGKVGETGATGEMGKADKITSDKNNFSTSVQARSVARRGF